MFLGCNKVNGNLTCPSQVELQSYSNETRQIKENLVTIKQQQKKKPMIFLLCAVGHRYWRILELRIRVVLSDLDPFVKKVWDQSWFFRMIRSGFIRIHNPCNRRGIRRKIYWTKLKNKVRIWPESVDLNPDSQSGFLTKLIHTVQISFLTNIRCKFRLLFYPSEVDST